MKSFVLFPILTLYSVKLVVSVSLFFPTNIILLLGKPPLWENFYQSRENPREGGGKYSTPRVVSFEEGEWKIPVLGRGD